MKDGLRNFMAGVVGIGMATAVLLPGRQTIGTVDSIRKFGTGMLGTAITGKTS